jgi:hypothetical protein
MKERVIVLPIIHSMVVSARIFLIGGFLRNEDPTVSARLQVAEKPTGKTAGAISCYEVLYYLFPNSSDRFLLWEVPQTGSSWLVHVPVPSFWIVDLEI